MSELEQQRIPGAFMGQSIVAALTQGVPEQQAALAEVGEVFLPVSGRGLSELTPLQGREGFFLALAQSIKDVQGVEVLQMTQVFEQAALRGECFILRCNNIFL